MNSAGGGDLILRDLLPDQMLPQSLWRVTNCFAAIKKKVRPNKRDHDIEGLVQ